MNSVATEEDQNSDWKKKFYPQLEKVEFLS
jgi:hypothetical protein